MLRSFPTSSSSSRRRRPYKFGSRPSKKCAHVNVHLYRVRQITSSANNLYSLPIQKLVYKLRSFEPPCVKQSMIGRFFCPGNDDDDFAIQEHLHRDLLTPFLPPSLVNQSPANAEKNAKTVSLQLPKQEIKTGRGGNTNHVQQQKVGDEKSVSSIHFSPRKEMFSQNNGPKGQRTPGAVTRAGGGSQRNTHTVVRTHILQLSSDKLSLCMRVCVCGVRRRGWRCTRRVAAAAAKVSDVIRSQPPTSIHPTAKYVRVCKG